MHLYDQIKTHFVIPDAYTNWTDYRNALTQVIIKETEQVSLPLSFHASMAEDDLLPTLLVIGAGACNDIDLHALASHFSHITLLDSDTEAMQQALITYQLEDYPTISCEQTSLTGITDVHYRELCDELQFYLMEHNDTITPQTFAEHAISLIKEQLRADTLKNSPLSNQTYDYVCCFGVHSQLLSMYSYIYHAFDVNLRNSVFQSVNPKDCDKAVTTFMNYLKQQNNLWIPLLNTQILSCGKKAVWFGLETKKIPSAESSAIEGAYQAIADLQSRNLTIDAQTLIWPFYPKGNISYEMWLAKVIL